MAAHKENVEVYWYLTAPDGRSPWSTEGARKIDLPYLRQIASAVDQLGFTGALLATGPHDTWVLGSSLISSTNNMRFLIAVHPPLISPVLAAKMAQTFDDFSGGRVLLNIVNGNTAQMRAYGSTLGHDERYAYTDEWIQVWKQAVAGESLNFHGKYITAEGKALQLSSTQKPTPPLWFGGSSQAAHLTAAKHIDTYLSWGETPPQVAEKIKDLQALAAEQGRTMRYGIRLYLIVRDTDEEAWQEADRLLKTMDPHTVEHMQSVLRNSDSVGQQRMLRNHNGQIPKDARELEIYPDLWAGMSLVRPGPGTTIVGSPATVLARLREYQNAGISTFIFSGVPLLEEAYRVGEYILPHLRDNRQDVTTPKQEEQEKVFTWAHNIH
ncbi:alkanesulfonate monooxygenase [Paenibacillus sp. cl141a]|uniref:LLM class flavin-dependent oxidoreductase n=1 Tax=Paenibacillus sp. cl141a TaxID=1761877 RepID=UPI0008CF11CC|nr:LLM class flavin-dependent oxidoreductase [Paenibacillus sp. cl141a]SEM24545.1 alkanesulfonate monooxygenase [Paenibacillus sp. cl141a]